MTLPSLVPKVISHVTPSLAFQRRTCRPGPRPLHSSHVRAFPTQECFPTTCISVAHVHFCHIRTFPAPCTPAPWCPVPCMLPLTRLNYPYTPAIFICTLLSHLAVKLFHISLLKKPI
jgi:hypothetical protein